MWLCSVHKTSTVTHDKRERLVNHFVYREAIQRNLNNTRALTMLAYSTELVAHSLSSFFLSKQESKGLIR